MEHKYVQTSNHHLFMATVGAVEAGSAKGAQIVVVAGEPGAGKTSTVDHFGAERQAIYIDGVPGMGVAFIRDLVAYELGVSSLKGFALQQAIVGALSARQVPLIFDEAQHGLEQKAAVIEYLRRIADKADVVLILVCHTSEKHRFAAHKMAHIATRISAVIDFKPANLDDTRLYLREVCAVPVDEGIAKMVLKQSRGRYRLMVSAVNSLETRAKALGKAALAVEDVKGYMLCEDAMLSLRDRSHTHQARKEGGE